MHTSPTGKSFRIKMPTLTSVTGGELCQRRAGASDSHRLLTLQRRGHLPQPEQGGRERVSFAAIYSLFRAVAKSDLHVKIRYDHRCFSNPTYTYLTCNRPLCTFVLRCLHLLPEVIRPRLTQLVLMPSLIEALGCEVSRCFFHKRLTYAGNQTRAFMQLGTLICTLMH